MTVLVLLNQCCRHPDPFPRGTITPTYGILTYFSHMQHIIFHYFYFVSVKAELGDTKYDIADRLQVFLKRMTKDAR